MASVKKRQLTGSRSSRGSDDERLDKSGGTPSRASSGTMFERLGMSQAFTVAVFGACYVLTTLVVRLSAGASANATDVSGDWESLVSGTSSRNNELDISCDCVLPSELDEDYACPASWEEPPFRPWCLVETTCPGSRPIEEMIGLGMGLPVGAITSSLGWKPCNPFSQSASTVISELGIRVLYDLYNDIPRDKLPKQSKKIRLSSQPSNEEIEYALAGMKHIAEELMPALLRYYGTDELPKGFSLLEHDTDSTEARLTAQTQVMWQLLSEVYELVLDPDVHRMTNKILAQSEGRQRLINVYPVVSPLFGASKLELQQTLDWEGISTMDFNMCIIAAYYECRVLYWVEKRTRLSSTYFLKDFLKGWTIDSRTLITLLVMGMAAAPFLAHLCKRSLLQFRQWRLSLNKSLKRLHKRQESLTRDRKSIEVKKSSSKGKGKSKLKPAPSVPSAPSAPAAGSVGKKSRRKLKKSLDSSSGLPESMTESTALEGKDQGSMNLDNIDSSTLIEVWDEPSKQWMQKTIAEQSTDGVPPKPTSLVPSTAGDVSVPSNTDATGTVNTVGRGGMDRQAQPIVQTKVKSESWMNSESNRSTDGNEHNSKGGIDSTGKAQHNSKGGIDSTGKAQHPHPRKKVGSTKAVKVKGENSVQSGQGQGQGQLVLKPWSCISCTFDNEPNAKKCAICSQVRDHAPVTPTSDQAQDADDAAAAAAVSLARPQQPNQPKPNRTSAAVETGTTAQQPREEISNTPKPKCSVGKDAGKPNPKSKSVRCISITPSTPPKRDVGDETQPADEKEDDSSGDKKKGGHKGGKDRDKDKGKGKGVIKVGESGAIPVLPEDLATAATFTPVTATAATFTPVTATAATFTPVTATAATFTPVTATATTFIPVTATASKGQGWSADSFSAARRKRPSEQDRELQPTTNGNPSPPHGATGVGVGVAATAIATSVHSAHTHVHRPQSPPHMASLPAVSMSLGVQGAYSSPIHLQQPLMPPPAVHPIPVPVSIMEPTVIFVDANGVPLPPHGQQQVYFQPAQGVQHVPRNDAEWHMYQAMQQQGTGMTPGHFLQPQPSFMGQNMAPHPHTLPLSLPHPHPHGFSNNNLGNHFGQGGQMVFYASH